MVCAPGQERSLGKLATKHAIPDERPKMRLAAWCTPFLVRVFLCALGFCVSDLCLGQGSATLTKLVAGKEPSATPTPTPVTPDPLTDVGVIEKHLAEAKTTLEAMDAATGPENFPGSTPSELRERRSLLSDLIITYRHQLARRRDLAEFKARHNAQEPQRSAESMLLPEAATYSFLAVDQLRESERSVTLALGALKAGIALIETELERWRTALKQSSALARQAAERIESNRSPEDLPRLRWLRELAELRARFHVARIAALEGERALNLEQAQYERERLENLRAQLARTRGKVVFAAAELQQVKANLLEEQEAVGAELESATNAAAEAEADLQEAEETRQRAAGSPTEPQPGEERTDPVARGYAVELKRAQKDNLAQSARLLSLKQRILVLELQVWEQRWAVSRNEDVSTLRPQIEEVSRQRAEQHQWQDLIAQRLSQGRDLINESESLVKRARSADESMHQTRMAELYRERVALYDELQQSIQGYLRLLDRWAQDIEMAQGRQPIPQRLESRFMDLWQVVLQVWNYEVFVVEDRIEVEGQTLVGKRSLTLGKFVNALLILVIGYWLSRWISRRIERMAVKRFGMDASGARLARRWTDALGLLVLAVIALNLVKIPLTVFAFLGGAVAIGVGFGMQTLFKNLMSGLIILFERPFQLSDLVEVGSIRGRITDVGLRSSVIRDMTGIETLIPNSSFLEQNVTNWTYSNQLVRFSVKVGVAYGTEVDSVRRILLDVGARHGLVLKKPAPLVMFDDFGADALLFSLHFWLELHPDVDRWVVQSDLRFMIHEAFAKAGILIAYPQRDVHLDSPLPLRIQMIPAENRGQGGTPDDSP